MFRFVLQSAVDSNLWYQGLQGIIVKLFISVITSEIFCIGQLMDMYHTSRLNYFLVSYSISLWEFASWRMTGRFKLQKHLDYFVIEMENVQTFAKAKINNPCTYSILLVCCYENNCCGWKPLVSILGTYTLIGKLYIF